MKTERKLKRELSCYCTPEIQNVLPGYQSHASMHKKPRRTAIIPVCIVMACLMVVSVAGLAPVIAQWLNSNVLSENNRHLTEVPEGYTAIYTLDDLRAIDTSDNNRFILMNDLDGGGADWVPVTPKYDQSEINLLMLNGNGYVIRNLNILGYEVNNRIVAGIFGESQKRGKVGVVMNLGVENCRVNITITNHQDLRVCAGVIVSEAQFIGGCYAENCEINVQLDYPQSNCLYSRIGGLGGRVSYIDSCIADVDINVSGNISSNDPIENILTMGGVAGMANSVVTSLNYSTITVNGEHIANQRICAGGNLPAVIPEAEFHNMLEIISRKYTDSAFPTKKFKAYFLPMDPEMKTNEVAAEYMRNYIDMIKEFDVIGHNPPDYDAVYLFDPWASLDEVDHLMSLFEDAIGGSEAALEYYTEHHIKCGIMYCYSPDRDEKLTEESLYGFNFETIWTIKNGKAVLRVFQ